MESNDFYSVELPPGIGVDGYEAVLDRLEDYERTGPFEMAAKRVWPGIEKQDDEDWAQKADRYLLNYTMKPVSAGIMAFGVMSKPVRIFAPGARREDWLIDEEVQTPYKVQYVQNSDFNEIRVEETDFIDSSVNDVQNITEELISEVEAAVEEVNEFLKD